jgi:hypothetical protein
MRLTWAAGCVVMVACASSRIPEALRRYQVLVEPRDSQSVELARAMRASGFRVRNAVRGGSGPTAALIYFTFREPGPGETTWLHVRLADTRSGVIVRAGSILLDSLTVTPKARAQAAVQALLGNDSSLVAP